MATICGIVVTNLWGGWSWVLCGAVWQFTTLPKRGLWRNSASVLPHFGPHQPLIVDDAVMFSLGWEHRAFGEAAGDVAIGGDPEPPPKAG